jgi:tetratricopeptide (TPR) repeat protein
VRQNVADLLALRGDHLAAARAYEKAIDAMESALGADHVVTAASRERFAAFRRSLLPVVLDRVSLLVAQADFQDEAFHRSVDELVELVRLAPLTERGYTQVRAALLQSALSGPTERVLGLGVERFPDSRVLRIHLADIYAGTGRTEAALNMLEETGRLSTPEGTDRNTDIRQQAVIFERIGDMYLALFEYDEAIAAYQRVIEIDRTAPGGHQKLARAYVSTSRLEEARAQLGLAAEVAPGDPSIHLDMAETLLSMGEAAEAVRAADRAIELGTTDPSILFIRGRALVVDGRTEEGQAQIQEYQQIDADLRAEETRTRNIDAVANRALEAFRNGDPETAAGLLEEGIRSYPAAERLHMASGIILGRAGRHQEAVDRFEAMLAGGVGRPFLVHLQLSEQYAALGDIESSRRHGAAYEQRRESEIVVVAPE